MRAMFEPFYGDSVHAWPVGIDTASWSPTPARAKDIDVLVYDKILWRQPDTETGFVGPLRAALQRRGLRIATIRYGHYREEELRALVARSRCMVFLCEHESQGIAYQQVLSCGVPILAWDRGGLWPDPSYYPQRARFGPVTSVPYWDERCGSRFTALSEFDERFDDFWTHVLDGAFAPREYVEEHLTLEKSAQRYLAHVAAVEHQTTALAAAT